MKNYNEGFAMAYYLAERYYTTVLLHHGKITAEEAKNRVAETTKTAIATMGSEKPLTETPVWPTVCSYIQLANDLYYFDTGEYDTFDTLLEMVANGRIDIHKAAALMQEGKEATEAVVGPPIPEALKEAADYKYDYEQDYRATVLQAWQSGEITAQRAIDELKDAPMPIPHRRTEGPRAERDQWNLEMTAKLEAEYGQTATD